MARARLMPHQTADPASITWGAWWVRLNGHRALVDETLAGWDYAADLQFELQPTFDWSTIASQTGVGDPNDVAVVMLLDCPSTGTRLSAARTVAELLSSETNMLTMDAPSS